MVNRIQDLSILEKSPHAKSIKKLKSLTKGGIL
jgi:hypothetical protein